jgi:hypothetical protein
MLQDETCFFLAVDLDEENWQGDAAALLETCRQLDVPAALEALCRQLILRVDDAQTTAFPLDACFACIAFSFIDRCPCPPGWESPLPSTYHAAKYGARSDFAFIRIGGPPRA